MKLLRVWAGIELGVSLTRRRFRMYPVCRRPSAAFAVVVIVIAATFSCPARAETRILATPSSSTMMLLGDRSRCSMPMPWIAPRPAATWRMISTIRSAGGRSASTTARNVRPSTNSIAMYGPFEHECAIDVDLGRKVAQNDAASWRRASRVRVRCSWRVASVTTSVVSATL